MNKQVVIAGLLGAIAAAEGDDPTPCSDIVTKAAAEGKTDAEDALEAWEGKIEALEEVANQDAELLESATEAYEMVTDAVLPFYNAMEDAYEDWQDAIGIKQAAQGVLTTIETGADNTISGNTMLLGEEAPTVSAALGAVSDAQEAYNDKFAEINSATYEDAEGETETGFRAYLTAEIRQESLMLDAESTAGDAESLAIENYEDQEAVVNALLTITGCAKVSYADLGLSAEEEEATEAESEAAIAAELAEFEVCCNSRLSTYLAGQEGEEGCAANNGFGMAEQRAAYLSSQTTLETTYNNYCESSQSAGATESCDQDSDYTAYRTAYLAVMKAKRMRDVVDAACNDTASSAYDCSNGILSNSGTEYTNATEDTQYHLLNLANGTVYEVESVNTIVDKVWIYRESATVNTAAIASTESEESTWQAKYQGLANALKDWTVAEARYWAYEAAWEIHSATYDTADDTEGDLKTTRDQKVDLLDAADAQVLAANKRVEMATSDLGDEITALDALQATLVAAEEAHAVEVYLAAQADAAALVQANIIAEWSEVCGDDSEEATCFNALDDLEALYNTAESNFDDVQAALSCNSFAPGSCTGFYRDAFDEAAMAAGMSSEALEWAEEEVMAWTFGVEVADAMLTEAIEQCKGLGYDKAQAAKKALMDLESANEAAAAEVAIDYAAKSGFADTGETNTLCAFPAQAADGSQEPRPECKDGYCCGAAQKFLKDGTKLAIETCQKAEGVHTYDYYPPLPEGSPVEPTPETWRFQCISGAQKLAATAAAALAASYMMA